MNFQSEHFGFDERVRYYYPFQDRKGRTSNLFFRLVHKISLIIQHIAGVHRNKGINFQKGTNWFSITDELARYTLSKREWIYRVFHATVCCDEIFLHTLIINSKFRENLYHKEFDNQHQQSAMRLIDWKRGSPYTFRISDLEEIKASEAMFARKFDEDIDKEIILAIRELYS